MVLDINRLTSGRTKLRSDKNPELRLGYAVYKGNKGFFHMEGGKVNDDVILKIKKRKFIGNEN